MFMPVTRSTFIAMQSIGKNSRGAEKVNPRPAPRIRIGVDFPRMNPGYPILAFHRYWIRAACSCSVAMHVTSGNMLLLREKQIAITARLPIAHAAFR
jgi:hypothetical protein